MGIGGKVTTDASRNPEGKAIEARPPVGAYLCEPIEKHADYWKKGAWNEPDRAQALICMEQAVNAWKNLAYALARSAHYYAMEHIGRSVESPSEIGCKDSERYRKVRGLLMSYSLARWFERLPVDPVTTEGFDKCIDDAPMITPAERGSE